MSCLILIALGFPRLLLVYLWFFTDWYHSLFDGRLWPLLGFLLMPYTLLWYSAVHYWFHGTWSWWHYLVMVFAIVADIGSGSSANKKER